jgi:hypothetical protein
MHNFTRQVIESDFNVSFLGTMSQGSLFFGFRKGGTTYVDHSEGLFQIHTAGVWHFVSESHHGSDDAFQQIAIQQWHIPRYRFALAAHNLLNREGVKLTGGSQYARLSNELQLYLSEQGTWSIAGKSDEPIPLTDAISMQINEEIRILKQARNEIKFTDEEYEYDGILTPAGNAIRDRCLAVVEAIAFEKITIPELFAGNFGIFSAFCTFRDFDLAQELPTELMQELFEAQLKADPKEIDTGVVSLFMEAQNRLLKEPIWGEKVVVSVSQASRILYEGAIHTHERDA